MMLTDRSIPEALIRASRKRLFQSRIRDSTGNQYTNAEYLTRAYALADQLRSRCDGRYCLFLLPTSAPACVAALAAMVADKVPVFLNFTASQESLAYAIEKCEASTVFSSRKFVEAIRFTQPVTFAFLEDIAGEIKPAAIRLAKLRMLMFPSWLARMRMFPTVGGGRCETATVLFSSGSTGTPKGVVLSHDNLLTNLEAIVQTLACHEGDVMLGALPFFHSFGYIGNFLLPLVFGLPVIYHPNPTDAATIGDLIAEHRCTVLFATPTFLQGYIRKCKKEQLASLQVVVTGAEKLQENVSQRFTDTFGIVPIEGYGCTELSPVVSINVADDPESVRKACGRPGSVGRAIPGVDIQVVDPNDYSPLPVNNEGLLRVRGPNVMQGYLGEPERTTAVIRDGWYNTGDMARIDGDGFLYITGRYSRFSKIGGEMIPHGGVEEAIHKVLGSDDSRVIVTGVADAAKGERLVVLYLDTDLEPKAVIAALRKAGLPNLWIPKVRDFHKIECIPLLGSGKFDLKTIRDIAERHST